MAGASVVLDLGLADAGRKLERGGSRGEAKRIALLVAAVIAAFVLVSQPAAAAGGGGKPSVVGGGPASISSFPFMAKISSYEGLYAYYCTGTVVAPNMVLTAAHCLLNESSTAFHKPASFEVLTGTDDLAVPGTVSPVERLVIDPNYEPFGSFAGWHDAGLIQLAEPVSSPPVQLATSQIWGAGTLGYVVGWGLVDEEELPTEMQVGETVVQSQGYCDNAIGSGFHSLAELCSIDYPTYRSATCNGDSGGPMLMVSGQRLVEIGITSFGIEEGCPTDSPRVDTRADVEAAWVSREIAAHPPKVETPQPPAASPTTSTPRSAPTVSQAPASPAPSPELPKLTSAIARRDVFDALRSDRIVGFRFRRHSAYRATCRVTRDINAECRVRWRWSGSFWRYWGLVTIFEGWEGAEPVGRYHYWIHGLNTFCVAHSRRPTRCSRPLFHV